MSWRNLFRRNKADREWREEMEANIDLASDAFLAQGMTSEQARAEALKRELLQGLDIGRLVGTVWQDRKSVV